MPEHTPDPLWDPVTNSALSTFIRESLWAYPALETVHLIGLALIFGPILMFDLRVLGRSSDMNIRRMHQTFLPWVWTGFALNIASGVLLFISDAAEFASSPALYVKLALIALAGINALMFQRLLFPRLPGASASSTLAGAARVSAAVSILLWTGIIVAGRMVAYIK